MTVDEVRVALARAAGKAWPEAAKASELPFPAFWKSATEWLSFHAPHVGDKLMLCFVQTAVTTAKEAERFGTEPKAWVVPEEVRAIWSRPPQAGSAYLPGQAGSAYLPGRAGSAYLPGRAGMPAPAGGAGLATRAARDAWEHAAERAARVRDRFSQRSFL